MLYLVSYDLNRSKESDYPQLLAQLRADGAVRVLYSEWLVNNSGNATDVANRYLAFMDSNDGILVTEVTTNTAWRNLQNEPHSTQTLQNSYLRRAA